MDSPSSGSSRGDFATQLALWGFWDRLCVEVYPCMETKSSINYSRFRIMNKQSFFNGKTWTIILLVLFVYLLFQEIFAPRHDGAFHYFRLGLWSVGLIIQVQKLATLNKQKVD